MALEKINYQHLTDFVALLTKKGQSTTSIQQNLVATRKVFNYAHGLNLIRSLPKFPNITIKQHPRGSFTVAEYLSLVRTARRLIGTRIPSNFTVNSRRGENNLDQFAVVSQDMSWMIRFMINSFMRPSDIKFLQHKHVTVVRAKHIYLRLNLPETKKHDKPIVTLQAAVYVYERLLTWQKSLGYGGTEDYVFLPNQANRDLVLETYRWQFNFILQQAGIGKNASNGQTRTLYSLRHSSMTFRLLYGRRVDLLTLARNARTSVEMVEKFYSSNLNAEMNIDLLQGLRD
jgi:integrase